MSENNKLYPYQDEINEKREIFLSRNPEKVYAESFDGLKLAGYYLQNGESKKTIILFHGYTSAALNDFAIVFDFYLENGFNILTVDQRAHGESEGKYIGFGVLERHDALTWIEYINARSDHQIILDGISMGGTTVLMASGYPLPENVKGIIADCAFISPKEIFKHIIRRDFHLPPFPVVNIASIFSKVLAGYYFGEYSTLDAMKINTLPTIFIHGGRDNFVPTQMSKDNYQVCIAPKKIVIADDAGHGMSYLIERERCQRELVEFLNEVFEETQ